MLARFGVVSEKIHDATDVIITNQKAEISNIETQLGKLNKLIIER